MNDNEVYLNFACLSMGERDKHQKEMVRIINEFKELLRQAEQLQRLGQRKGLAPLGHLLNVKDKRQRVLIHVGGSLLTLSEIIEELVAPDKIRLIFDVSESEYEQVLRKWKVFQISRGRPSKSFIEFLLESLKNNQVAKQFQHAIDVYKRTHKEGENIGYSGRTVS